MSEFAGLGPLNTMSAATAAGLATLSRDQDVTFTKYVRYVLPLDGFVFWLKTESTTFQGSLHASIDDTQNEDDNISINRIVFSTKSQLDNLNEISPNEIWVGEWSGLKFAFSRQGYFFEATGLYHYMGDAVYPVMESQLVDVGSELSQKTLVVSNSLPAWLRLRTYTPVWLDPPNPLITAYPSYSVPSNLRPPYIVIHIDPAQTQALQATPWLYPYTSTSAQLARDWVKVTMYGLTNQMAIDWFNTVFDYSLNYSVIGIMSQMPIIRDEKRGQVGLDVLAMKKTMEFEVSYTQARCNDVARQLIKSASATVTPQLP